MCEDNTKKRTISTPYDKKAEEKRAYYGRLKDVVEKIKALTLNCLTNNGKLFAAMLGSLY